MARPPIFPKAIRALLMYSPTMEPIGPKIQRAIGRIMAMDKVGAKMADNVCGICLLKKRSLNLQFVDMT
ncbi:hypothetical protein DXC78_12665 [Faecalicoccus pleomorphus]|uniref:Uncharacterized protein n=1 Tax=Faecalicoccus pleomorphus TaxID=1323 RepID=A0A3E3DU07_9FIRM|nr:hypothetical protein DXC78_12665 [Faecalicoccus pleomorphus]